MTTLKMQQMLIPCQLFLPSEVSLELTVHNVMERHVYYLHVYSSLQTFKDVKMRLKWSVCQ